MIRAGGLINGIEYIGDDEFVVTKERLQELMTNELFVEFYDCGVSVFQRFTLVMVIHRVKLPPQSYPK